MICLFSTVSFSKQQKRWTLKTLRKCLHPSRLFSIFLTGNGQNNRKRSDRCVYTNLPVWQQKKGLIDLFTLILQFITEIDWIFRLCTIDGSRTESDTIIAIKELCTLNKISTGIKSILRRKKISNYTCRPNYRHLIGRNSIALTKINRSRI